MKALVLLSGGIDSSTCLALAINKYGSENVIGLCMYYGQKHNKEIEAAKNIAKYYKVELYELNLSKIFEYSSCSLLSQSDKEIPQGTYEKQLEKEEIVSTYVPFRNGLFLSSAASFALSKECEVIYYGAHSDDSSLNAYPDTSEAFNNAINSAIEIGSGHKVKVLAPFINKTKKDVVEMGLKLNVPFQLTWSCYEGEDEPCHKCATCIDREEAFIKNNTIDPLVRR